MNTIFTPGGSKEVYDGCVCARHWFWHSLVGQFSTSIKVKHLGRFKDEYMGLIVLKLDESEGVEMVLGIKVKHSDRRSG